MTSEDMLGTAMGIAIVAVVIAAILAAMFYRPTPHKKTRSRATFTHGIDDSSVDGDGGGD